VSFLIARLGNMRFCLMPKATACLNNRLESLNKGLKVSVIYTFIFWVAGPVFTLSDEP
jgi:hypothetical protein